MRKFLSVLCLMVVMSASCFAGDILPNGFNQEDQYNYMVNLNNSIMNASMGDVGLGISASPNSGNIAISTTINYTIDGVWYQLNSNSNISTTANYVGTITSQNVSTYCKYLVSVTSAGAFKITKGNETAYAASAILPALPTGNAAIGYFRVATGASNTFKFGVSKMDGTGITTTYVDLRAINSGKSAVSLTGL